MSYHGRTDPENTPQTASTIALILALSTVAWLVVYGAYCLIVKVFL